MKKGISPVVAVVLLIAIAVIAAVGVWYWVGAYTGQPNVTTSVKTFTVQKCNGTHVYVQNNGQEDLDSNVNIYDSSGTPNGAIAFGTTSVSAGSSNWVAITGNTSAVSGSYEALGANIQTTPFSC